jgi:hypothetical protein
MTRLNGIVCLGLSTSLVLAGTALAGEPPDCDVVVAGQNLPAVDPANVQTAVNTGGAGPRTVCLAGVFDFGEEGFVVIDPEPAVPALAIVGLNDLTGKAAIRNGLEPFRFSPASTLPVLRIANLRFERPSFAAIAIFRGNQRVEISGVHVDGVESIHLSFFGLALREGIVLTSTFAEIAGEVVIRDNVIDAGTYGPADLDDVNFGILASGGAPLNPFPITAALTIERNEVLNWAGSGIGVVGVHGSVIQHNRIRPGPVALELSDPSVCVANGILLGGSDASQVQYNTIDKDLALSPVSNAPPACSAGVVLQGIAIGSFVTGNRIAGAGSHALFLQGTAAQEENRFLGNNLTHFAATGATVFLGPQAKNNTFIGHVHSVEGNVTENAITGPQN